MTTKLRREAQTRAARQFSSKDAVIPCHIPTVIICGGDYNSAALLEQILYWSGRTDNKDGWIAKTYEDWGKELWKSPNTIRDTIKRLESKTLVETRVFRSQFYEFRAVQHVRINEPGYAEALDNALNTIEAQDEQSDNPNRTTKSVVLKEERNPSSYIAETTTETTERDTRSLETDELPDHLTPAQRKVIQLPDVPRPQPDGGAQAFAIVEAYADAWDITTPRYRDNLRITYRKPAEQLASMGATPDEVRAMCEERRARGKQPDEVPLTFLARDYVSWKSRPAAAPTAAGSFWGRDLTDGE